jgi:hypothetical protein
MCPVFIFFPLQHPFIERCPRTFSFPRPSWSAPLLGGSPFAYFQPSKTIIETLGPSRTSILPGELPGGYTGWRRPSNTTAPRYKRPATVQVDHQWKVRIQCKLCVDNKPFFYTKAYGPAVLGDEIVRKFYGCNLLRGFVLSQRSGNVHCGVRSYVFKCSNFLMHFLGPGMSRSPFSRL